MIRRIPLWVWYATVGTTLLYMLSRSKRVQAAASTAAETARTVAEIAAGELKKLAFSTRDPTDKVIASLASRLQPIAHEFVTSARAAGFPIVLVSGSRSIELQNEYYEKGRTKPGGIVTNARGGDSAHNFGLAFDFAFGDKLGNPTWPNDAPWASVAAIGKQLGLKWGGDWKSFKDQPHLETADWREVRAAWKNSGAPSYAIV